MQKSVWEWEVSQGTAERACNEPTLGTLPPPRAPLPAHRHATDAAYLVCNELSGDSTVLALSPDTGATLWALSTSSLAQALVPVRAAAAAQGMFLYADTGSNVTALSSADGALLWRVDIERLVPTTVAPTSVTHLHLADGGGTLLVR